MSSIHVCPCTLTRFICESMGNSGNGFGAPGSGFGDSSSSSSDSYDYRVNDDSNTYSIDDD